MSGSFKFSRLFQPGKIGPLELKNRTIMASMGTRFHSKEGYISARGIDYYLSRARGGVGLILTEGTSVGPDAAGHPRIDEDSYVAGLGEMAKAIQAAGVPAMIQININRGLRAKTGVVGPSEMRVPGTDVKCRALTTSDVSQILGRFGDALCRARDAGFDGIEIHGGHGYLISNFLSPLFNKRTDEYGGDLNGRAKFALDAVRIARKRLGRDYPLIFRMVADEKLEGGLALSEAIRVAKLLELAGVNALDVVSGSIGSEEWVTPHMRMPAASNSELSAAIKAAVKIPVIVAGKITDPAVAEDILKKGKADFVALGRALIADPQFVDKARSGEISEIRKCIGCLRCREAIAVPSPLICSVNPSVGRERDFEPKQASRRKKVLVVGGGPGGLTAAAMAGQRGHDVTLWEQGGKVGGQLNIACLPPGKAVLSEYIDYLEKQVAKAGVRVELGKRATPEKILEFSPDAVILAIGSKPTVPLIKGMERTKVFSGREVLTNKSISGKRIIVIGGGHIGCEVAEFLADLGKDVTIVEILENLLQGVFARIRNVYLNSLSAKKIRIFTGVKEEEFIATGMNIVTREGRPISIEADTVIFATGASPERGLAEQLAGKVSELFAIGDCAEARTILETVQEGADAAMKI